jgi:membrane-bound inhibitor of C-type lysozyme
MKTLAVLAVLALLAACASSGSSGPAGPRMDWRCDGGAAFSARIATGGRAEVFAGGQQYSLPHVEGAGARYANGNIEYWERGGLATLNGARGGPYTNCRRG